jgi:hypothetical protein
MLCCAVLSCRPYPIMTGTAADDNDCDGYELYPLEVSP